MTRLHLSVATGAYDRVQALRGGQVRIEGCDINLLEVPPEELFFRVFRSQEFDVCEASLSSYLMSVDRGDPHYTAIPVFPSRVFRHSSIYIRDDVGIRRPEDLKGLRIGVPEYQVTGAVWARGLLDDDYGVRPADLEWFSGGLHQPGRREKVDLALPGNVRLSAIPADRTLDTMLAAGEIDALISPRAPNCFLADAPHVTRLFADPSRMEQDYFARTGIFPIMHVIVIRTELVKAHRWLASSVFQAFEEAKNMAMARMHDVSALAVMLPWLESHLAATAATMGRDYWPYGVEANRTALDAVLRYGHEHGTLTRRLEAADIFATSTLEQHKV